ncbi:MAG: DUF1517 domain-containing protein [Chloroherpetonaceae bacterium]|nr:DUF1517 domain-containing protein [Chloroherpetonaceae bacterium]MDW8438757.1 DUF1517 domain-containing protein [Chloroherpetonaceae bacterium]
MTRRNFFSNLFGSRRGESVFIGIQVAINAFGDEGLRSKVHRMIEESADDETPEEKRRFYKRLVATLVENQHFFEYGYWDVISETDAAEAEFENWVTEIEASIATEEEEMGERVNEMYRFSSAKYYVVITLCLLFEDNRSLDPFFEVVDSIPESEHWTQKTFGRVLAALNYLDFEFCLGDAAFIMPGNEEDGISMEDITGEGWDYLRSLS